MPTFRKIIKTDWIQSVWFKLRLDFSWNCVIFRQIINWENIRMAMSLGRTWSKQILGRSLRLIGFKAYKLSVDFLWNCGRFNMCIDLPLSFRRITLKYNRYIPVISKNILNVWTWGPSRGIPLHLETFDCNLIRTQNIEEL